MLICILWIKFNLATRKLYCLALRELTFPFIYTGVSEWKSTTHRIKHKWDSKYWEMSKYWFWKYTLNFKSQSAIKLAPRLLLAHFIILSFLSHRLQTNSFSFLQKIELKPLILCLFSCSCMTQFIQIFHLKCLLIRLKLNSKEYFLM